VVDADTLNTFKSRLDKHWLDQDVFLQFSFRVNWNQVLQFVCDVVKDTDKEEYLRPFIRIGLDWIVLLYKAMVRPHLEYANSVWCLFKKGVIKNIEKVQKRATKLIISLKKLQYLERLRQLKLPTLKYNIADYEEI